MVNDTHTRRRSTVCCDRCVTSIYCPSIACVDCVACVDCGFRGGRHMLLLLVQSSSGILKCCHNDCFVVLVVVVL